MILPREKLLVRIIAGEHRGRRLESPPGEGTRPILDRVREALFGTLGERVIDARVLDLFAGPGSLALEALSRGAARARAVESDARVAAVLARNAESLGLSERVEIARADALDPRSWSAEPTAELAYDLAFLDPPFAFFADRRRQRVLDAVDSLARSPARPLVVLRAPKLALRAAGFAPGLAARERSYGGSSLWYVEVEEPA